MNTRRLRTVALLARRPGLLVLRDVLIDHPNLELSAVITHRQLPRDEGGGDRPELAQYRELCKEAGVPLSTADFPEAKDIAALLPTEPLDLLVSLSWRYLVPQHVLGRFSEGCINLHRGALPTFAGSIPVQRAIEAGENQIAITAHEMVAEVDAGAKIAEVWVNMASLGSSQNPALRAEELKSSIEPLYAPLLQLAVQSRLLATGVR